MSGTVTHITDWLATANVDPIDAKLVPGATRAQRQALAALGGLVSSAAGAAVESKAWPEAIRKWTATDFLVPATARDAFSAGLKGSSAPEFLASIYETCVAGVNRRHLGTFFTPPRVVTDMLGEWQELSLAPKAVVDIGAGVGAFTIAATELWPEGSVYGVDINPITLGLLGVLGHARGIPLVPPSATGPGLRLVGDDFMAWSRDFDALDEPRLILGNPPYTRLQLLPREERHRLAATLPGKVGSRASLATWMLAKSLELLGPADGLALLLPAHWLEADYAAGVRKHLWQMYRREVRLKLLGAEVFPDARIDAVSLLVGPESELAQPLTTSELGRVRLLDRTTSTPAAFRLPSSGAQPSDGLPLASVATTRRGTATGANHFFLLSEEKRTALGLPAKLLVPLLRRLHAHGERVTDRTLANLDDRTPRWMLLADDEDRVRYTALRAYVRAAELDGANQGYLCSQREVWFDLRHDLVMPDVVIGPTTRSKFPIVVSGGGIAITNNLYGLTWRPDVPRRTQTAVVAWLRADEGQRALRALARHQAHDLWKLEPGALKKLTIPDGVLNG